MSIPPLASVAYRLPVVASVARAQALAGFGINHDALAVSPEMPNVQLVSFCSQNIHCIGRKAVFDENLIGEPLMMKPWCIHRFLDIKLEIDHAHENVGHGCNDSWTAGRSDNQKELSVLEHDRSEEHTSELQSRRHLVCVLLL